jgi:integrase
MSKLTKFEVDNALVGMHYDGGGLYLRVREGKDGLRRSWMFRYTMPGQSERTMGLGPYPDIKIAEARHLAYENRRLVHDGIDPIAKRNATRESNQVANITFAAAAAEFYARWSQGGSAEAWRVWSSAMKHHVLPVIGSLSVATLDQKAVLRVLDPIWATKHPTAKRMMGAMLAVIDFAVSRGYRDGNLKNPAAWSELKKILPPPEQVHMTEHHPALPWKQIARFMADLRAIGTQPIHGNNLYAVGANALEFQILTCARPGEAQKATWEQVNLDERIWTIKADGMKSRKQHRVPLSDAAVAVLEKAAARRKNELVFPGRGLGKIQNNNIWILLGKMGYRDVHGEPIAMHGFRSTFCDWAHEARTYLVEMCVAHACLSDVEKAYNRSDLLERRRQMLEDWARQCNGDYEADVVVLADRRKA